MFLDEATIRARAGSGGSGAVSFRREKYVPRGGPDGGDGGRGGSVVLVATPAVNTLIAFSRRQHFTANRGGNGARSGKTGATADDIRIEVPLGTVVHDA